MASQIDLRTANLDGLLKTQLVRLCKDLGLSSYGLKSALVARLLAHRAQLPPLPMTATTSLGPTVTAQSSPTSYVTTTAVMATTAAPVPLPHTSGIQLEAQQAAQQAAAQVLAHFSLTPPSSTAAASAGPAPPPSHPAATGYTALA